MRSPLAAKGDARMFAFRGDRPETVRCAVYHPGFAKFLAGDITKALRAVDVPEEKKAIQIESVVVNDILSKDGWKVEKEWEWIKASHAHHHPREQISCFFDAYACA